MTNNVVFGWCQEVVIESQVKVYKDVIEPLESFSISLIPTTNRLPKDLGPHTVVDSFKITV